MINWLKTYFRNKAIHSIGKAHKAKKSYITYADAQNILILFDGTLVSKYGRINKIIKSFQNEGKQVTCLSYFDHKELDDICLTQNNIQFISKSNFTWLGVPNDAFAKEFVSYQYDICINLTLFAKPEVEVLCRICDAKLKIGKQLEGQNNIDFMINMPDEEDETFLVDQIKYYLRSVKSNKHS